MASKGDFVFAGVDKLGQLVKNTHTLQKHIDAVVNYELVDVAAIKRSKFKIVVDGINSTGSTFVPALLRALGVKDIIILNEEVILLIKINQDIRYFRSEFINNTFK